MASSQVEFASSSPFGCVLKDHNRRDRCRDSNSNSNLKSQSNFQRNLKELVRDHLQSCISISPRSSDLMSNENSRHQRESLNCWGCSYSRENNSSINYKNPNSSMSKTRDDEDQTSSRSSRRNTRVLDRWAAQQARETITTIEKRNQEAEILALSNYQSVCSSRASSSIRDSSPAPSDSSADVSVHSLVQKWRGIAEAKPNNPTSNQNQNQSNNGITAGRTSSASSIDICSSVEASETATEDRLGSLSYGNGRPSLSSNNENDSITDSEYDKIGTSDQASLTQNDGGGGDGGGGHVSDGERERIRVADIIRKWTRVTKSRAAIGRDENESQQQQQQQQQAPPMVMPTLAWVRNGEQGEEPRGFLHPVGCSPRLRGRQAIADLFMRMERERQKEIEGLATRQAVSKFPQRGRIQSVLRLRFLRHGTLVQDQRQQQSRTCELNWSPHSSTITSLRERFTNASEQDTAGMKNSEKSRTTSKQDSIGLRTAERSNATSERDSANIRSMESCCIAASEQNSGNTRSSKGCSAAAVQDSTDARNSQRLSGTSEQYSAQMRTSENCKVAPEQSSIKIRSLEGHKSLAASVQDSVNMRSTEGLGAATTDRDSASMRSPERCAVASDMKSEERSGEASELGSAKVRSLERCIEKDYTNVRSPPRDVLHDNLDMEKSSTSNQLSEEAYHQLENSLELPNNTTPVENSSLLATEDPSANVTLQEVGFATVNLDSEETPACHHLEEDLIYEEEDANNHQYFETNLDWIYDISRPRSYWEDRRKAWYQEIFEGASTNEEIRNLIESKSVSAVLSSAFRERMDQLMSCHARRMHPLDGEEEEDLSMRTFLEKHMQPSGNKEEQQDLQQLHRVEEHEELEQAEGEENYAENTEEEEEEDCLEDEEERSPSLNPYHDVSDYFDQTPSSSQWPWSHCQEDHDASDDFVHVTSTTFQQSSVLHSSDHDMQEGCSFKNATSNIEVELIYVLRAQIEQLHSEMSELRKSINSCAGMQAMLHSSIREGVAAAMGRSDREKQKGSSRKTPKKGCCCICYEKKVDSLLYRCGHMCTCFECAHDLQQSTGKCPICRAQIVDVVRAYTDT